MKHVYAIEAYDYDWSRVVATAQTAKRAKELIKVMTDHKRNAPEVDWNSKDDDKLNRQMERLNRYFKRGPGGESLQHAADLRVIRVRFWEA